MKAYSLSGLRRKPGAEEASLSDVSERGHSEESSRRGRGQGRGCVH